MQSNLHFHRKQLKIILAKKTTGLNFVEGKVKRLYHFIT